MGDALDPKTSAQWWRKEFDGRRHEVLVRVVDQIYHAQNYRRDDFLRYARMYGARSILGLSPTTYSARMAVGGNAGNVSFNVVKSCSDSYVSKLTKDKPKVSFVTSDGDKQTQDRAKGLERFCDGQLYELGFYEMTPSFVLDTCWAGNAIAKFLKVGKGKNTKVAMERVQPHELLVDDAEGIYGKPRNMYQIRYIDRGVLSALYPQYVEQIRAAPRHDRTMDAEAYESLADYVLVRFAWHLPSTPPKNGEKSDGRYTVAIVGATLEDEEWRRTDFPFVVLRRSQPLQGWWGPSLIEELRGIQREINVLLYKIQRHYHLIGVAHWFVAKGSVNKAKLDNDLSIIEHLPGQAPSVGGPNVILAPEIYAHLDRLYQRAYELVGVSPMTASSSVPAQIQSGKAMQVLADVQSDRFMTNYRLYEAFVLNCVKQILTLAREISEENEGYAVRAFDSRRMAKVVFSEHWLEDEEYVLKMYPTNLLADEPSARMSQVQTLANAGWMEPQDAMRLLDYPDISANSADKNATYNAAQRMISKILEEGEFIGPDPVMQLSEAIPLFKAAVVKTIAVEGVDQERVEMLRRWLVQANDLQQSAAAPPPAAAGPPASPPGAGAPPTQPQLPQAA